MISKMLLVFGAFGLSQAYAGPNIGDQVSYSLTHTKNGLVDHVYIMNKQIVSIDSTAQTINVSEVITENNQTLSSRTAINPFSNVAYPDDATIATCGTVTYPGQTSAPETITVAAGTFKTCHIVLDNNQGEYWAAAVPFGFAKSVNTNTTGTMIAELASFQLAPAPTPTVAPTATPTPSQP